MIINNVFVRKNKHGKLFIIAFLVASFFLQSCTSSQLINVQFYPGPALSKDKIAILINDVSDLQFSLALKSSLVPTGEGTLYGDNIKLELLPGSYRLHIQCEYLSPMPQEIDLDAEAGHRYKLHLSLCYRPDPDSSLKVLHSCTVSVIDVTDSFSQ
jgi:hypothetical protein